ncbi:hydrolase, partial [Klebsiella pneumoniae]
VLREGAVIGHYHKLHLYDAFAMQESRRVDPGQQIPPVIEVAGGECGTRNIGLSRIVDPLGTTLAGAGSEPQLIFADLSADDLAR